MAKAVCCRCSTALQAQAINCPGCTWPCHPDGWSRNRRPLRRLTLDTGCVNARGQCANLNQLEAWQVAGHIVLERTPAMKELRGAARIARADTIKRQPRLFMDIGGGWGNSVLPARLVPIEDLRLLLIPKTTPAAMSVNWLRDLEHLQHHVRTGADLWITKDTAAGFIDSPRREALYRIGIWAFTPLQAVAHLVAWHSGIREASA